MSTHNQCFSKNKKNSVYPCKLYKSGALGGQNYISMFSVPGKYLVLTFEH